MDQRVGAPTGFRVGGIAYLCDDEAAVARRETWLDHARPYQLDTRITEATLLGDAPADYAHAAERAFAFRLARALKAQRELVRGKPEVFTRPDYSFRLDGDGSEPRGDEPVHISPRRRGSPRSAPRRTAPSGRSAAHSAGCARRG